MEFVLYERHEQEDLELLRGSWSECNRRMRGLARKGWPFNLLIKPARDFAPWVAYWNSHSNKFDCRRK